MKSREGAIYFTMLCAFCLCPRLLLTLVCPVGAILHAITLVCSVGVILEFIEVVFIAVPVHPIPLKRSVPFCVSFFLGHSCGLPSRGFRRVFCLNFQRIHQIKKILLGQCPRIDFAPSFIVICHPLGNLVCRRIFRHAHRLAPLIPDVERLPVLLNVVKVFRSYKTRVIVLLLVQFSHREGEVWVLCAVLAEAVVKHPLGLLGGFNEITKFFGFFH
mmetsp:Transcript_36939/g.72642  ORF Transcript_36939/g.72642 Transcript_36939/m.72642 type:complete len:216 (+) Transcript_36939:199-846(+)